MSLVVDASVAVKWVVAEDGRETALAVPDISTLLAPDFVLVESASVLWKKVRRGEIARQQMFGGIAFIRDVFLDLVPLADLIDRAAELAVSYDHPIYDCLYVACAEAGGAELLTADAKLAATFSGHRIQLLGKSS